MKKSKQFVVYSALALLLVMSCGGSVSYVDGTNRVEADEFHNGWKYFVVATVKDGKITEVEWDAVPEEGEATKYQASVSGNYPMVEQGGAKWPWHEQADAVEKYLLETQSLEQPDAITGASVGLEPFYTLMNKAVKVKQ